WRRPGRAAACPKERSGAEAAAAPPSRRRAARPPRRPAGRGGCRGAPSLLACGAMPGAAPALHAPPDRAAVPAPAGLAFAVVDVEALGEVAEFAVGPGMVAQAGAARLDRLPEHLADGRDQPLERRLRDFPG